MSLGRVRSFYLTLGMLCALAVSASASPTRDWGARRDRGRPTEPAARRAGHSLKSGLLACSELVAALLRTEAYDVLYCPPFWNNLL